jgi:hypothetical protein
MLSPFAPKPPLTQNDILNWRDHHYVKLMANEHPHADATFRVVPQKDLTFGVEVKVPGSFPAMVTSFAQELAAETWIAGYKQRVAEYSPYRYMRGKASKS